MKKKGIILLTAILCGIIAAGCSDKTEVDNTKKKDSVSQSESISETEEQAVSETSEKEEDNADSQSEEVSDNGENSEEDGGQTGYSAGENDWEDPVYSSDDSELTRTAVDLYDAAMKTYWELIFGCNREFIQDDSLDNGAVRIDVDSIDEIRNEFEEVFCGNKEDFDSKYFEQDGKVYGYDGGRGGNIYYVGTELIPVSADDSTALFTAVSHYADPETGEPMDNKSYDFEIKNIDGKWKVAQFRIPN